MYGPYLPNRTYFWAQPDHLKWNVSFEEENSSDLLSGLRVILDDKPCGIISCCKGSHCTNVVSGHLKTKDTYLYGHFKLLARVAYPLSTSSVKTNPEVGVLACWTIIYHMNPHNEIAMCWDSTGSFVHLCYWYDDNMHRVIKTVGIDMSSRFIMYEVMWNSESIIWIANGKVLHTSVGIAGVTIPYLPGTQMLILRPTSTVYVGAYAFEIASVEYQNPTNEMIFQWLEYELMKFSLWICRPKYYR